MIRPLKSAALAALLALTGIATTANRADAQVFYSGYPGTTYYYRTTPNGGYWTPPPTTYSYYTPAADPNAALAGNSAAAASFVPVRTWDGGWTLGGYTSPAIPHYNSYRALPLGFRR